MKKIFFLGTPEIAVPTLEVIAQLEGYQVVGVGVFPDKKVGRKQVLTPCSVKAKALELELPIIEIADKKALIEAFKTLDFDLAVVIAFGMIFPKSIFELREKSEWDIVNIHFSLLPEYRGASPVQAAILDGRKKSGITWQQMVYELDEGDLLCEAHYEIAGKSTSQLWDFFADETARLTPHFLELYFGGALHPLPQQDLIDQGKRKVSKCGMFEKSDGLVTPSTETAEQIYQKYLAFDVWPEIYVEASGKNIKLTHISLEPAEEALEVKCSDGKSIFVIQAQMPGKRPMQIEELLRGHPALCLDGRTK